MELSLVLPKSALSGLGETAFFQGREERKGRASPAVMSFVHITQVAERLLEFFVCSVADVRSNCSDEFSRAPPGVGDVTAFKTSTTFQ